MSPFKKISTDPAFWSLIIMNLLFVQYFREQPNTFKTYVWLYWLQSVMIGIFNFFTLAIANGFTGSYATLTITIASPGYCPLDPCNLICNGGFEDGVTLAQLWLIFPYIQSERSYHASTACA